MRVYLVIYMVNMTVCLCVLIIIFPHRSNFTKEILDKQGCQQIVAFVIVYELLVISYTVRIGASGYMSIKQSRSIQDCNK